MPAYPDGKSTVRLLAFEVERCSGAKLSPGSSIIRGRCRGAEPKRTKAGRYLMAAAVPAFIQSNAAPTRCYSSTCERAPKRCTSGWLQVSMRWCRTPRADDRLDPQRDSYRLKPLQDFVPEVTRRLQQKALPKSDMVVLICRSGDRSARLQIGWWTMASLTPGRCSMASRVS